jgi:HEAT repeat protein
MSRGRAAAIAAVSGLLALAAGALSLREQIQEEWLIRKLASAEEASPEQREAFEALGRVGSTRAIAPILGALGEDPPGFVVPNAFEAIAAIHIREPARAIEALSRVVEKGSARARRHALDLVTLLGPLAASLEPRLRELLHDPAPDVRETAAEALFEMGVPGRELLPTLVSILEEPGAFEAVRGLSTLKVMGTEAGPAAPLVARCLR